MPIEMESHFDRTCSGLLLTCKTQSLSTFLVKAFYLSCSLNTCMDRDSGRFQPTHPQLTNGHFQNAPEATSPRQFPLLRSTDRKGPPHCSSSKVGNFPSRTSMHNRYWHRLGLFSVYQINRCCAFRPTLQLADSYCETFNWSLCTHWTGSEGHKHAQPWISTYLFSYYCKGFTFAERSAYLPARLPSGKIY